MFVLVVLILHATTLRGSQVAVTQQVQEHEKIEKYEDDKFIRYSFLCTSTQEVFVYKICKETRKTFSYLINPDMSEKCRRKIVLIKFKDDAFRSLQKAYEEQEKIATLPCAQESKMPKS